MAASCAHEERLTPPPEALPDGTPVSICIPFGASENIGVTVGTKAEASIADESRVHDLYVLIFDSNGDKFYGRYFTYEHLNSSLSDLGSSDNEGWWVSNVTATTAAAGETSKGVVRISTEAQTGCTMIVVANLDNAVTALDEEDPIDRIAEVSTLTEFKTIKVQLEQNVVNRDDLFLMLGYKDGLSTSLMRWYSGDTPDYSTPSYSDDYKIELERVDAKVQFRIRIDSTYISNIDPRYWQVFNVPSSCYLFPGDSDTSGDDRYYFGTDEAYFEEDLTEDDSRWQVFTFYMLENRQTAKSAATEYYDREKQEKNSTGASSGVIYSNGDWVYAPDDGTYVKFDAVLTLTSDGIAAINSTSSGQALTTDAVFTVHLGDFTSSTGGNFDDYNTYRNHSYSYDITIQNSNSIYVEVTDSDRTTEPEPAQEGSLLFATDTIVHCDAHYEYLSMTFKYTGALDKTQISWDVKTPFGEGGAEWDGSQWVIDDSCIDYEWVKFAVNEIENGAYNKVRQGYPGDSEYDSTWTPESTGTRPELMNIHQLIQYLFDQIDKKSADPEETNEFLYDSSLEKYVIRVTAFVNEYYYETDPRTGEVNPDLWREFVNASPRELHILSDAQVSADGQSDIVSSSHSIIQNSIQTIYNISSPFLTSIWGTEHKDEMRNRGELDSGNNVHCGWKWMNDTSSAPETAYCNDYENGRFNTAGLWGINPEGTTQSWSDYVKYEVDNSVPELRDGTESGYSTNYRAMAYSCMTRNRDNDGDGSIDADEVRWYLASVNQLTGLWVGNEALSPSARIYQPQDGSSTNPYLWRAHVVTSTCSSGSTTPLVVAAEEGASLYNYPYNGSWKAFGDDSGQTETEWNKVQSVRCLRNIGTYEDGSETKDISYAPLTKVPDQYYIAPEGFDESGYLNPNDDGTYTVRFDNLNTKSIREYVSVDLPFHSEYSAHNRVYLELNMQDPTNTVVTDGSLSNGTLYSLNSINEEITSSGNNAYCPAGYRLPNMTELCLMKALLPYSTYWPTASGQRMPSRTYFSKGMYDATQSYNTELKKSGWAYNKTYVFLANKDESVGSVRCVRDENVTGDISGKITTTVDRLRVNESTTINFNFTSSASAFTDATLALCYTDANGDSKELSIPANDFEFYNMTLMGSVDYTIPSDLTAKGRLYFKATLRNSAGQVESFTTPITIIPDISLSIRLLPCEYDDDRAEAQFPILINAMADGVSIDNAWLDVTDPDGNVLTTAITSGTALPWTTIYNYKGNLSSFSDLQIGTYSFQMMLADDSGYTTQSNIVTMEILRKDYQPGGSSWSDGHSGAIGSNDFIEAKIDISNSATNTRENIISIGTIIGTAFNNTNAFHLYYPDTSGNNMMRMDPTPDGVTLGARTPYLTEDGTSSATSADLLIYRLDPTGVYWNGIDYIDFGDSFSDETKTEYYTLLSSLCTNGTLRIGSTEGNNRSNADYKYIRVVHNGTDNDLTRGNGSFDSDPVNGGSL